MKSLRDTLSGNILRHYQPRAKIDIAEWVKANLRIEPGQSADYAGLPMDVMRTPHARLIYDFLHDPEAEELNVQKSSAAALTSTAIAACFYYLKNEPCNILYLISNQTEARKMSNRYWKPWLRQVFGDAVADDERQAAMHLQVNGVHMISGSPTESVMRATQYRLMIEDESDTHPCTLAGGAQTLEEGERERVKNSVRSKILRFSSPLKKWDPKRATTEQEQARINRLLHEGDQREYRCPCPGCAEMQPVKFDDLQCDDARRPDGSWILSALIERTYWQCPLCRYKVREGHEKRVMVESGLWVPTVQGDGRIWSALHTDLVNLIGRTTWGRIKHDMERRRGTPQEAGVRRMYLAEPEDTTLDGGVERDKETILRHCGHYARGTCPVIPWQVTTYVDVQKNCERFPWVTHALGMDGTVHILDWGECETFADIFMRGADGKIHGLVANPIPLTPNETAARARWPDPTKQPANVFRQRILMDSGYMARGGAAADDSTDESVYQFCLSTWEPAANRFLVCPAKGRSGKQITEPTVDSIADLNGRRIPLLLYDDHLFKRDLYNVRLASDPDNPTSNAKMRPRIYFPRREDLEEDHASAEPGRSLLSQMLSERVVVGWYTSGTVKKHGPHWKAHGPNDYGDGVKGGLVMYAALSRLLG